MVFKNQPEEVPTHAQVKGQLGSDFPVVVDLGAVVILSVIGQGDVRDENGIGPSQVPGTISSSTNCSGITVCHGRQHHLCASRVASSQIGDVRIDAVEVKLSARPG